MRARLPLWSLLAVLCGCGGGGGGGPTTASITGAWFLTPTVGGIVNDSIHLTLEQTGDVLVANVSCLSRFPPGSGRWDGRLFTLVFTFGSGATLSLEGGMSGGDFTGSIMTPDGPGTFYLQRIPDDPSFCAHACDILAVPRFVNRDFTDLSFVREISRFRSSAGRSFTDDCESCRSMRHHFSPFPAFRVNNTIPIRCPVDGQVLSVTAETHGASAGGQNKQVRVRSTSNSEYSFLFFHVDLAEPHVVPGTMVSAGDLLGTARMFFDDLAETANDFQLAVRVHTAYTDRYVSWFEVLTDGVFASYAARGVPDRGTLMYSRAARDANPLTCTGQTFTGSDPLPIWFVLGPP